ncbi:MAG: ABC transporter ATP-binding protein [Candidatus Omnitrophica bacterium]|nr:ABC transporter ATP-binding protein [Candidatus Omnitrophota bacterium]
MNDHKAVEVEKLEKKFGAFTAVNKISFSVDKGEIFGFLGPNGAGKSTTIKMLCGILYPTSGSGHVGGYDIRKEQESIKQNIGYMSQRFSLYEDLSVEENINFYSGIYRIPAEKRKERKDWVIKMAGLEEFKSTRVALLSGGWKQRLALGCAIIHEPKILFLDEPTSGVDPVSRQNFWALIKEMSGRGVTVFVTTHYMDEAQNCGRLALIYRGDIIAIGSPKQLKTEFMKEDVLEISLPGAEAWIERIKGLSGVREVALFGRALHALVENAAEAQNSVKRIFAQVNVTDYSVNKIQPSLEDVFVSLIEYYDKKISDEPFKG